MNAPKRKIELASLILMLPALFLSISGILFLAFGMENANSLLDLLMANALGKTLLSPILVFGGPVVVFALNTWQVAHLSADVVNDEFVVALSVKRLFRHLICMAVAAGLLGLLLIYAFTENFQIVAR